MTFAGKIIPLALLRTIRYYNRCAESSWHLYMLLKTLGVEAYIATKDGDAKEYGHVWVVVKLFGCAFPVETSMLGIPSPFFDYSTPDIVSNDDEFLLKYMEENRQSVKWWSVAEDSRLPRSERIALIANSDWCKKMVSHYCINTGTTPGTPECDRCVDESALKYAEQMVK